MFSRLNPSIAKFFSSISHPLEALVDLVALSTDSSWSTLFRSVKLEATFLSNITVIRYIPHLKDAFVSGDNNTLDHNYSRDMLKYI